jgi:antitoxin component HigA of HigAB toxin-antitoxin module
LWKENILTEDEYIKALARADELMDAIPDSPQEKELKELVAKIEKYEEEHFPIL